MERHANDTKKLINGHGRLIFYKLVGNHYFPDTQIYNSNDVENIEVYEIYEMTLFDGTGSKEPSMGRIFRHEENCRIGFLSYDSNPLKPALSGKGVLITQGADSFKEGCWDLAIEVEPTESKTINDFYTNECGSETSDVNEEERTFEP
jgi:hypothetical protein